MHPLPALRELGGIARWTQLAERGVTHPGLTAAVARGEIRRHHRGCYALPGTPRDAVLATIFRAELSCVSFAQREGLPVYPSPDLVHLRVPASRGLGLPRRRPDQSVVLHRTDPAVPHLPLTHLDLAANCTGPREQLALVDGGLRTGLIGRRDLDLLTHADVARRAWIRRHADPRSESLSETCVRVELNEAGLRAVPQAHLPEVGRVDFLVEGAVVLEVDSRAHHSGYEASARDRERDRAAITQGYVPLRYMFHDALERPRDIVDDVVATLMRIGRLTPELRTRMDAAARVSGWRELL